MLNLSEPKPVGDLVRESLQLASRDGLIGSEAA